MSCPRRARTRSRRRATRSWAFGGRTSSCGLLACPRLGGAGRTCVRTALARGGLARARFLVVRGLRGGAALAQALAQQLGEVDHVGAGLDLFAFERLGDVL